MNTSTALLPCVRSAPLVSVRGLEPGQVGFALLLISVLESLACGNTKLLPGILLL